ncbi:MAG: ABC transporter substrate-binding protein, partial [Planctomycetes bacterium]|nr:ABC transporter substrate-binding protein [Planctomycetota bacterium]
MQRKAFAAVLAAVAALALVALAIVRSGNTVAGRRPLVVYCAHDSIFSKEILDAFARDTGIPLDVRYDTEATKSLGLSNLIIREREHPRCDVFWNNQALGTMDLGERGLLLPYKGEGWQRIPAAFKAPDGAWTGFAARLRVYIVNTGKLPAEPQAIERAMQGDLSRMAVARPLFEIGRA